MCMSNKFCFDQESHFSILLSSLLSMHCNYFTKKLPYMIQSCSEGCSQRKTSNIMLKVTTDGWSFLQCCETGITLIDMPLSFPTAPLNRTM